MASNCDPQVRREEEETAEKDVLTYDEYLRLPTLLSCQVPKTGETSEILFLVVHQASELWFKQVLLDIDSVCSVLQQQNPDENLAAAVTSLQRIVMIFKLINQHLEVLETMAPTEFLAFRDELQSASGFQSFQFRQIEVKLGVKEDSRIKNRGQDYSFYLTEEGKGKVQETLAGPTLFELVEKWLENTPFANDEKFQFVSKYREQAKKWMEETSRSYEDSGFERILDSQEYQDSLERDCRRLSHAAFLGALVTHLYRHEPPLQLRYSVLKLLVDTEKAVESWRVCHQSMARRFIGHRSGTLSSGISYLKATLSGFRYSVFRDLFDVAMCLVPPRFVPPLN